MATLREFVLAQSTLPTGHTVREHIQNPAQAVGFVVENLAGTVIIDEVLSGTIIDDDELSGTVECD